MTASKAPPVGGDQGRSDQVGAGSVAILRRTPDQARRDHWQHVEHHARHVRALDLALGCDPYGDPARYLEVGPFGLTLPELRAEWRRCSAAGWCRWELDVRLAPEVAA